MALPTKDEICVAIENNGNIIDPNLSGYKTIDGLCGPESYSGGFCLVFPVTKGANKYAFRVWHTEIDGIKERLLKISSFMSTHKSKYFVDFDFVTEGLFVPTSDLEHRIPAVRMKWVDGNNLSTHIESMINDENLSESEIKLKFCRLADNFLSMIKELHSMGVSHGDLQHGNIIVDANQDIVLVDYDSVYVPTFSGELQITSGMAAYQHPVRMKRLAPATPKDDYFSERIIYLSLLALAEDPSIWNELKDSDGEKDEHSLLFSEKDFVDFTNCSLYKRMSLLNNSLIQRLLDSITDALKSDDIYSIEPTENICADSYLEQPGPVFLDDDDMSLFAKESKRTYKPLSERLVSFDDVSAFDRYSQN